MFLADVISGSFLQSAFARHVLNKQLSAVALLNPSEVGKTEVDIIFNDGEAISILAFIKPWIVGNIVVWANNGDAISRA